MRRNPWTTITGLLVAAAGVLWMVGNVTDVDIPWSWIAPALLVLVGLLLALAGRRHDDPRPPASQFERDDAPRVP